MAITLGLDGYCEESDVAILLQQRDIDSTSVPTDTNVETLISLIFSQINGMLVKEQYLVPMVDMGNHLFGYTQVQANAAGSIDDTSIVLKDSGGVLKGKLKIGDALQFAGHTNQSYVITEENDASSNLVTAKVRPSLIAAVAEDENVTYRGVSDAARTLKQLNALGAAALTEAAVRSAGGLIQGTEEGDDSLHARFTALWKQIEEQEIVLHDAARDRTVARPGTARLVRSH